MINPWWGTKEFDGGTEQYEITNSFYAFFDEFFDTTDMIHLQDIGDE